MDASKFGKLVKEDKLDSFYIFTGEDKTRLLNAIKVLKFDKVNKVASISELVSAYTSYNLFEGNQLLICEGEDLCEKSLSLLQRPSKNTAIVIMKSVDKRKKAFKNLKNIVEFDKMGQASLMRLIDKRLGVDLDEKIINQIIYKCEEDVGRIENECAKLKEYINLEIPITTKLINENINSNTHDIAFDLVGAIVRRSKDDVVHLLDEMYKTNESPVAIILLLYRQFRNILIIQGYKGEDPKTIADKTGLNVGMIYAIRENVGRYSIEELTKILKILNYIDMQIKRGEIDMYVGLEFAIIQILSI